MLTEEKDPLAPGEETKAHKVENAHKTWWFQHPDGRTFATQAAEAWEILRGNTAGHRSLKLVGCSDGTVYQKAVVEAHRVYKETGDYEQSRQVLLQGHRDEEESGKGNLERPPNLDTYTIDETKGKR